jgi:hypothetical protein
MNYLKSSFLFGALLCLSITTFAQRPDGPRGGQQRGPQGPNLEMLQKTLDLSEEQLTALKPILENTKKEMQALRGQEFESPEAHRTAAKAIMDQQKEKVNALLNADQIKKMEELQQKRQERGPKGPNAPGEKGNRGEKGKALRTALKTYHETNIEPVMQAQRNKLEAQLSAEDKTTIAALRAKRAAQQTEMKATKTNRQRPEPTEAQKAERKADQETIKALVTKYDTDIDQLLEEVAPQAAKWKADTDTILEQHRPKRTEGADEGKSSARKMKGASRGKDGKERKGKDRSEAKKAFHKAHFLMLDPSAPANSRSVEESPFQLQAYPNPAGSSTTINYTVKKDGQVNIVLRNKAGNLNRVLLSSYQEAGTYTLDINTSDLQGGNYFYTISDGSGSKPVTKQLLLTK